MKQLADFNTLAEAQAYEIDNPKMISPDLMLALLTKFDLVDILDSPSENPASPTSKEAKALRKAFEFGSEFNFIDGHPSEVTDLLTNMVNDGIVTDTFKLTCIAMANQKSKPYKTVSEQAFNDAKNPTNEIEATYPSDSYITLSYGQRFRLNFDCAETGNVRFDVYALFCNNPANKNDVNFYSKIVKPIAFVRNPKERFFSDELIAKNLGDFTKLIVVANKNIEFGVTVEAL